MPLLPITTARGALLAAALSTLAACSAAPYQVVAPTTAPSANQTKNALAKMRAAAPYNCDGMKISLTMVECAAEGVRMRIADTPNPLLTQLSGGTNVFHFNARTIDQGTKQFAWSGVAFTSGPQQSATQFVQGWAVLAAAATDSDEPDDFEQHALAYAAANPKPELPEDARRFRVQAEAAVRRNDFDQAAESFAKALEIAPWWPQGNYNIALIYSELGLHARAIASMRRYLRLQPDAANARQAQDKIYEWEAAAK